MTKKEALKAALLVGASVLITMFVIWFFNKNDHDVEEWLGSTDEDGVSVYTRLTEILDEANDDLAQASPPITQFLHDHVSFQVAHWGLKLLNESKTDDELRTILKSAWDNAKLGTLAGWEECKTDLEAGH